MLKIFGKALRHGCIVQFRVTTLDVGVPEEAEQIVKLAESLAPVAGVFHLAMYLADKLITNQASLMCRFYVCRTDRYFCKL